MVRRLVAAGAGIVVLLILIFLFRGCLDSRKDSAFKEYVRNMSALVQQSNQESQGFFRTLQSPDSTSDVNIENQLNTFSGQAGQLVERAAALNHPGELDGAQKHLQETLQFRRDGVAAIAQQLPAAIADRANRGQGTKRIAASMQSLLAGDVVYQTRFASSLQSALKKQGLAGDEQVPQSRFLPDVGWLQDATVGNRIPKLGGTGGASNKAATPGLHGTGITSATVGGQALTPGNSVSVPVTTGLKLTVQVANQGQNTETGVKISVSIGKGTGAVKADKLLDTIAAGETKAVDIPLTNPPPTGQNVPIDVTIAGVPGETKTDNNKASYTAIFTR